MATKEKILIVEDDPTLNEAFQTILQKEDYDVRVAFNGRGALEILERESFDLILLDLLMPVMGGIDFLKEYRPAHKSIPVIVFSNLDTQNDIEEAQKLGATRYMLKAWASPKDLVKLISDTLKA
jgi:DNA-binding response OmpR family regulator